MHSNRYHVSVWRESGNMSKVHLILLLIVLTRQSTFSASIDDLHRLRHHLFSIYTPDVRPLLNQSQPLVMDVNFRFMRIHHIDNTKKEFSIRGILSLAWKDEFLTWKSADFGDLRHYHPKKGEVWTPSILSEDGVGNQEVMETITRRVVYQNGSVVFHVPGYFSTFCNFDMTYFPFDSQTCNIKLNPLNHFAEELEFRPLSKQVRTIGNYKDAEWTLVWATMTSDQINIAPHYYSRIRVMFQVARKPLFAILNIVIPIVTISILSMMVFLVPVESGEKLSSLSALLSLAVFMSFISEQIPASSEKPPLLVIYLTSMVLLNALSVVSTVLVLLCHHRGSVDKATRACDSLSKPNTADIVMEKCSFRKLVSMICCGKEKKYLSTNRALNNILLLLFMGVVIGITISTITRMTSNN